MTTSVNASPRVPRQTALSDDADYEDKHMFPPSNRSHLGSPMLSRKSASSVASSVENSPAAPSNAKAYAHSPMQSRRSEPELLASPRSRSDTNEYPRYESRKRMSADFSDDTMSVGSVGGESPKSDRGSWRLHSAVSGPFLTGPLAKDFQTEHLKTPRGKARDDMNFDHSGLLFPLAPVLDTIPDTPRGGFYQQPQSFTDISQFDNSSEPMDGFQLDSTGGYASHDAARPVTTLHATRRTSAQAYNSQLYAGSAVQYNTSSSSQQQQQQFADGSVVYSATSQQQQSSSAIVATQASSNGHGPSYADVVVRNSGGNGSSQEQSLVAASASESLESLSQGMADSMAQILAKTQNGRTYGEVQLTTLVQKIHMHMTVMGRTSAAIREDYNRIKAKLEQTITDKKVLEATNYHLQQLVQQYEVERQYFHQYVLHSLQSQSSLIYESMGTLSQNVVQSKHTIEELSARLSRELSNFQGSGRSDSQLKEILEEIKRAVDLSALATAQQQQQQHSDVPPQQQQQDALTRSPKPSPAAADAKQPAEPAKASSFKLVPVLLAVLLWVATLSGVYLTAKSAALSELRTQQQPSAVPASMLPSDLDRIVDQIAQKLETAVQASEVRKLVYTELEQNPQLVDTVASEPTPAQRDAARDATEVAIARPVAPVTEPVARSSDATSAARDDAPPTESPQDAVSTPDAVAKSDVTADATVAPAPTTAVADSTTTKEEPVVEPAVPPVEPFTITDAAIAEMLRLNGFPTGVPPLDATASVRVDALTPPTVDASAALATKSDGKTDNASDVTSSVTDSKPVTSAPPEPEVVALEATKTDSSLTADGATASAAGVVEITIASAVNPEVIAPTESATSRANTTALEPAQGLDDSIALDALESAVVPPVESVPTTKPVDDPTVEDPSAPTADAVSTDESASPALSDDSSFETSASTTEVDRSSSDDAHGDSAIAEPAAPANAIKEADVATASVENASTAKTATVAVPLAERVATDRDAEDDGDDTSASSVLDQLTSSAPFTGLSMALRSLAHRFVESVDVPSLSMASDSDGLVAPESLSVVSEIARHADASPAEANANADDVEDAKTPETGEDVAPVESVAVDVDVAIEEPHAATDASEASERALASSDDEAIVSLSRDALSVDAEVVTVEVTAGGDVAAPAAKDSSEEGSVASADGMDALRSFFSTLESQVAELAAQDEATAAAQDTADDSSKSEKSDESAPDAAEARVSESSAAADVAESVHDVAESAASALAASSDNDGLALATPVSAADESGKTTVDVLATESPSVGVEDPVPAASVDAATTGVAPALDVSDASSVSADAAQDPAVDASTIAPEPALTIDTDATPLTTGGSSEVPPTGIETVDDASSSDHATTEAASAVDVARRLSSADVAVESPATADTASVVVASAPEPLTSETKTDASDATSDEGKADAASADDSARASESAVAAELKRVDESTVTADAVKEMQARATGSLEDPATDDVDADASADSAKELARDSSSDDVSAPSDAMGVSTLERELATKADDSVTKTPDATDTLEAPEDAVDAGAAAGLAVAVDAGGSVSVDASSSTGASESTSDVASTETEAAPTADATPAIKLEASESPSSAADSAKDASDASVADALTDASALASDSSVADDSAAKVLDGAVAAPASDAKPDASAPVDAAAAAADEDDSPGTLLTEMSIAPAADSDAKTATPEDADRDL